MSMKKAKINLEQLESLRFKMIAMPAKQKAELNIREAVKSLEAEIRSMLTDGYTLVDIARMFKEVDAEVTASTIAAYLRDMTAGRVTKKKAAKAGMPKAAANQIGPVTAVPAKTEVHDTALVENQNSDPHDQIPDVETKAPPSSQNGIGALEEKSAIPNIDDPERWRSAADEIAGLTDPVLHRAAALNEPAAAIEEVSGRESYEWELEPE